MYPAAADLAYSRGAATLTRVGESSCRHPSDSCVEWRVELGMEWGATVSTNVTRRHTRSATRASVAVTAHWHISLHPSVDACCLPPAGAPKGGLVVQSDLLNLQGTLGTVERVSELGVRLVSARGRTGGGSV